MSRSLGPKLPPPLLRLLDGEHVEAKVGETFLLLTVDTSGFPRVAMLSAGEVMATRGEVWLSLWPDSETRWALDRSGRATLMVVLPPDTYYVRLRRERSGPVGEGGHPLAGYACAIEDVLIDTVTYAEVTGGIGFRLAEPEPVVARWRSSLSALRSSPWNQPHGPVASPE